jgi:hypothetical protein
LFYGGLGGFAGLPATAALRIRHALHSKLWAAVDHSARWMRNEELKELLLRVLQSRSRGESHLEKGSLGGLWWIMRRRSFGTSRLC